MTEEQNELKKKILIGLGIFLLFFIPSLIAIINKFNYKESNILNRISKEESFLIVVKDKDTEMTKNIESYLKNKNYVYEDLDSTDEVRYKKVLYKLDISSDDIEEAENGMNGNCNCYFVVEGDGSVYPCDFYCMDEWKLGTVNEPFQTMLVSERSKAFLSRGSELHEKCNQCPHFTLCRGGCRRWRETGEEGKFDLNYLCPAYEIFFTHCSERIHKLGKMIQQKYGTYQEG